MVRKRISVRDVQIGKTGLPVQNFRLSLKFSSGTNQKNVYQFTSQPEFPGSAVNGKQSTSLQNGPTAKLTALQYFTSAACVIAMDIKLCLRGTIRSNQTSD